MEEDIFQDFYPEDIVETVRDLTVDGAHIAQGTHLEVIDNILAGDAYEYDCRTLDLQHTYRISAEDLEMVWEEATEELPEKALGLATGNRVCKTVDPSDMGTIVEVCDVYNGYDYIVEWDSGFKLGAFADNVRPVE